MPAAALLLTAALLSLPQEPVRVSATLSSSRIAAGASTTLQITVETRGSAPDRIELPALPQGLEIIATSDFSQAQISVPGGRSRATRRDLVIVATAPGLYRIPPATITVAGVEHRTAPLELIVSTGAVAPGPGAAPRVPPGPPGSAPGAGRSALRMWAWPDTAYVGQQVMLYAEATFGEDPRTRQSRPATFDPPTPPGFWIQDVPNPVTVGLRTREGRTIETQTFRRVLFPLDPGEYTIPPAHIHYEVRRGFLYATESRRASSDSVRLVVLPLPATGRPTGFTGAVGRLSLAASVAPARIALGEEVVITVEVEGMGNVKALPVPRLPIIEGAEILAPTQETRVQVVSDEVGGVKRFRWLVVPERAGTITIPPIEYGVFDPELRQYITLRTDTLRVEATTVIAGIAEDAELRPLRTSPGREPAGWARSHGFAAVQVAPLLLLALASAVRRRRALPPGPRQHHRRLRAELTAVRQRGGGDESLARLERLLVDAVHSLAPGGGLEPAAAAAAARRDPVARLREQGRAGAAAVLAELLADVRRARYAPDAGGPADDDLFRRSACFIDDLAPRRPWQRQRTVVAVIAACMAVTVTPGRAAAPAAFEQATAAWEAGDFVTAANLFAVHARAHPADPAGWYNLGLAAHEAGDRGRAVWAWLRASRLAPRDADLRHNISLAGAEQALALVRPPDGLAPGERALAAAAAWWLLVLAAALYGHGRASRSIRRRSTALAATAMLALGVLAVSELRVAAQPNVVVPLRGGAPLYAGPAIHDDVVGELAVGRAARLLERRDDWLLVQVGADLHAWVERAAVAAP
jgi:hypothetical protein